MTIAIWIIAICEVIRIIQNGIQLFSLISNRDEYDKRGDEALQAFKDSLVKDEMREKEMADSISRYIGLTKAGKEDE